MSLDEAQGLLQAAGLRPPLLFKPLWTDGREGSHGLAVLHDMAALGRLLEGSVSSELKAPLVVQQFVEHGGVLFKVGPGCGRRGREQVTWGGTQRGCALQCAFSFYSSNELCRSMDAGCRL